MVRKKNLPGIPDEVIDELDFKKTKKQKPFLVTVVVESHQAKTSNSLRIKTRIKSQKETKSKISL